MHLPALSVGSVAESQDDAIGPAALQCKWRYESLNRSAPYFYEIFVPAQVSLQPPCVAEALG